MAIERDVRQSHVDPVASFGVRQFVTADRNRATQNGAQSQDGFAQFKLAVTFNAGNSYDLSRMNSHIDVFERKFRARYFSGQIKASHL